MPYEYNKLRGRIVEKFGTLGNFAKEINVTQTTMSRKMNCDSGFSQEDILKWSNLLEIEPSEYGEYFFT